MNHFQRTLFTTVLVVSPLLQAQAPEAPAAAAATGWGQAAQAEGLRPLLVQAGSEAALHVAAVLRRVGERLIAGAPDDSDEGHRTWLAQMSGTIIATARTAVAPRTCH